MQTTYKHETLANYLPEEAIFPIIKLLEEYRPVLKISRPRTTKLGDYRPPHKKSDIHRISVNNDLNKYAFLITLLHEIAHLINWKKQGRKVKPHGIEWKNEFSILLSYYFELDIFPTDIQKALVKYIENPKASSCSDKQLYRALKIYDKKSNTISVEAIPFGSHFSVGSRKFEKIEKLRTRYKCRELGTKRIYLINGLVEVREIVDRIEDNKIISIFSLFR